MAEQRLQTAGKICQRHDGASSTDRRSVKPVPSSWKLTPQQQAFIDSFAADEQQKQ